eukprot:CAMPEP_0170136856 /NCGR_PEP_ID=MMETSP0033_2-20121228/3685_1 /TAXON_ID=195969 /ORGANISM="Dolichomastix tenuilepis, Strain CCMP3274" /LENGTH=91 /DNA_ID=CAMNT_0010372653 /DNA_START=242 /DNA_END=514 /DNA_ORIENTATION=+
MCLHDDVDNGFKLRELYPGLSDSILEKALVDTEVIETSFGIFQQLFGEAREKKGRLCSGSGSGSCSGSGGGGGGAGRDGVPCLRAAAAAPP